MDELYREIYGKKDRSFWYDMDEEMKAFTSKYGFTYKRDDDSEMSKFGELPVIVNYFFHEEVKKSAKKVSLK